MASIGQTISVESVKIEWAEKTLQTLENLTNAINEFVKIINKDPNLTELVKKHNVIQVTDTIQ